MKKIYVILLFSLTSFVWSVETTDSVFQKSNELYVSNNFEDAIDGYLSILNQEINNQVLYYNIGNAYYRLDKLGYARLYYEKAKNSIAFDKNLMEDIIYNIEFLDTQLVDEIRPLPEFFLVKIMNDLKGLFSNNGWAFVVLVALYFNIFLFLLFLFSSSTSIKAVSIKCLLFLFPFLIFVCSVFYLKFSQKTDVFAVLISHNTYVKTAPSVESSNQFIIHEGLKFQIIDMVDDWSRVLLSDGKDGWVNNDDFIIINK